MDLVAALKRLPGISVRIDGRPLSEEDGG